MGFGVLRKNVGEKQMAAITAEIHRKGSGRDGCACPICSLPMMTIAVKAQEQPMTLDTCQRCGFIWFDAREFEAFPEAPPPPHVLGEIDPTKMTPEARERLAMAEVQEMAEQARVNDPGPDQDWKGIPAMLGLPVELDSPMEERTPWATYLLSLVIAGVSLAALPHLAAIIQVYGLIPNEAWRENGLTLLTSFFLHGGLVHLFGNLYFLLIFGSAVEKDIGPWRWLLLITVAALTGDMLHIWGDPRGDVPCIGASGGISGLIAYYALKFPKVRLGMLVRYAYVYWQWIQFPAWVAFLLWMLLQSYGVYAQRSGMSSVSALAHFGGVGAGVVFWLIWRNRPAPTAPVLSTSPIQVKIR